jgi:hypothetical protein
MFVIPAIWEVDIGGFSGSRPAWEKVKEIVFEKQIESKRSCSRDKALA